MPSLNHISRMIENALPSMYDVLGITEVDVKDIGYYWTHDIFRLRTMNGRKFWFTGQLMVALRFDPSKFKNAGLLSTKELIKAGAVW